MPFLKLVCLVLWVFGVFSVLCVDYYEEFKKHSKMVSEMNLTCNRPQPRVFYLDELVNETEWKSKYESGQKSCGGIPNKILPWGTVLYRCDSAGCCQNKETRCLPAVVEDVNLTFTMMIVRAKYFTIPVRNHTLCACQSTDTTGKMNIK